MKRRPVHVVPQPSPKTNVWNSSRVLEYIGSSASVPDAGDSGSTVGGADKGASVAPAARNEGGGCWRIIVCFTG